MGGLNSITDTDLKDKIIKSIQYITVMVNGLDKHIDKTHKEEACRIIILYVVAIIEAILLFFYKKRGEKILTLYTWKYLHYLKNMSM